MKFVLAALILLSACEPMSEKAKLDTCFMYDAQVYKVVQVGQFSFQAVDMIGTKSIFPRNWIDIDHKVDCFDNFDTKGTK